MVLQVHTGHILNLISSLKLSILAEPEDPEHQVSNYQEQIVAASSVASTSRVKIPAKNDNLGPKTMADYSRHKGGTDLSKNNKGKLKSTSQELATDNYLHESLFSDSDGMLINSFVWCNNVLMVIY